jgi:protein TonB
LKYLTLIELALAASLVIAIGASHVPIAPEKSFDIDLVEQEIVQLEEIIQTTQIKAPPPPPRPPVPIEVPDDEILEDLDLNLDATLDLGDQLTALPPPPDEDDEEEFDADEVFVVVEQMPEIIGGVQALMQAVAYPPLARKAGIEGMVVVKVQIDENGVPSLPQILRSASSLLDEAAIEAIMKQRFKPGRQRNRPVKVEMAFPVNFRLRSER